MNTCILLSTCDKYVPLAELTVDLLGQRWENHPPIFVCGVSFDFTSKAKVLNLSSNPRNWIEITGVAVDDLLKLGYRKCYLILEDHPPLAICNQMHLNETLPALMDRLGAAYIGLYGWDQGTLSAGKVLTGGYHRLQRQEDSFLWRFSLHPALWDLEALRDMIAAMPMLGDDIAKQSVWAFERRSGTIHNNEVLSPHWQGVSYRIFGVGMLAGKFRLVRALGRRLYFYFLNATLLLVRKLFGTNVQEKLSDAALPDGLFFDGPYPLYWSGVMQKGSLNKNFERFLLRHNRTGELDVFRRVIDSFRS